MDYLNIFLKIRPYLLKHNSPRWVIVLIDLTISIFSFLIAYFLRFGFSHDNEYSNYFLRSLLLVISIRLIFFLVFKVYSSIVRYTSFLDIRRIIIYAFAGTAVLILINYYSPVFNNGKYLIPFSILGMELIMTIYFMTNLRLLVKHIFLHLNYSGKDNNNVIIYGSRELAIMTKTALELDTQQRFRIVAFVDNVPKMANKKIAGISVYSPDKIDQIFKKYDAAYLIFAKRNIKPEENNLVVKKCFSSNIKLLTVPDDANWINGRLSFKQIRELKIEDLLEREPIILDIEKISNQLSGKVILVTGAAGSIGSEIVRQLARFRPKMLVLLDQAETPLYNIEMELKEKYAIGNFEIVLCDIQDQYRIRKVFELYAPDIVYHAAAYKHVPMMENNPIEGVQNNVIGTKILADISSEFEVQKFIMISTDKAVNPIGLMGATKRIAEMYIQSLNYNSSTSFITTRFGNVLGSNGSVIPRFLRQIKEGGPITITHPEITRYFMTISEACQLVLEASVMGKGGEIFLFDMGKAIKILDLAKNMIKLSGHMLNKDIEIKFTGLRPGEKLYEELLLEAENHKPTYHPKIMVAEVYKQDFEKIASKINELIITVKLQDSATLVRLIKDIVPTIAAKPALFEKIQISTNKSKMVI